MKNSLSNRRNLAVLFTVVLFSGFLFAWAGVASLRTNEGNARPAVCVPLPTGAIGWWRLDGDATDALGINQGTLGGAYAFVSGKVNLSWQVTNGSIRVPDSASLRPANAITVEGWVKNSGSPGSFRYLFGKNYDSCSSSYGLYTGGSGSLIFYVRPNASCFGYALSPAAVTAQIWDGQYHHVAGTYDGIKVRLFVDGVEQGTGTSATGPILYQSTTDNGDVFMGNQGSIGGTTFSGNIDEMTLYGRALTLTEIQSIFNASSSGKCGGAGTPTPTPTPTVTPTPTPSPTPAGPLSISGLITDGSAMGLVNVTVQMSGSSSLQAFTDTAGRYTFSPLQPGGNYTVTPSRPGAAFQPTSRTYNNLTVNQSDADFSTSLTSFTISGKVSAPGPVGGLPGAILRLEGTQSRTTTADSSGRYSFANLPPGSYTVEPDSSSPDINFFPPSREFSPLDQNKVANFNATFLNQDTAGPGRIAFVNPNAGGGIYVMDGNGRGETRIYPQGYSNASIHAHNLAWNQDGTMLAFNLGQYIYIMNYDGSGVRQLPLPGLSDTGYGPSWSPDSSRIAFASGDTDSIQGSIYTINTDGTDLRRLTLSGTNGNSDDHPDWSADNKIAFTRHLSSPNCPQGSIYSMNADGTNVQERFRGCHLEKPVWQPGSNTLAYRNGELLYFDGAPIRLNPNYLIHAYSKPSFRPDGLRIAYESPFVGLQVANSVWTVPIGGGSQSRFSPGHDPAWAIKFVIPTVTGAASEGGAPVSEQITAAATVSAGNVSMTFNNLLSAGDTSIDPISPEALLPLPSGYSSITAPGLAYDISTTASFSGPVTTCISVPSVNDPLLFGTLRILRLENDTLIDRTILAPDTPAPDFNSRTVCSRSTSVGPLLITRRPSQSLPNIDGLIVDSNGQPISDVVVTLDGSLTIATQSDVNGRFTFAGLPMGGNYTVTPLSGGAFAFNPGAKIFNNLQVSQGETFAASACSFSLSSQGNTFIDAGGSGSFGVNATAGCTWAPDVSADWIHITAQPPTSGDGLVQFSVDANTGLSRSIDIVVGGRTYNVNQNGSPSALVSLSGRVTAPDGRGVRNAAVSITDSRGVKRTVTTSSFGFYTFDNVELGEPYTMRVASKQYRFASQNVQPFGSLTDVDFVGLE